MAEILYSSDCLSSLRGRVVVITGGAQGTGSSTVSLLYEAGAHIVFGDLDETQGAELCRILKRRNTGGSVKFRKVDVQHYNSQLYLFDVAYRFHGRVDVAICCATAPEPGPRWFSPDILDLETVRQDPTPIKKHIEINLTSVIAFARLALAYLHAETRPGAGGTPLESTPFSKSIVFVSSIEGITAAPGLFSYSPAKHGVIGLMRSLREIAPLKYEVRVNAIAPRVTDSQLSGKVKKRWIEEELPLNQTKDVAKMIVQCAADSTLNGKVVLVSGGQGFDTEEGFERMQREWMGELNLKHFHRAQEIHGMVRHAISNLGTTGADPRARPFVRNKEEEIYISNVKRLNKSGKEDYEPYEEDLRLHICDRLNTNSRPKLTARSRAWKEIDLSNHEDRTHMKQ